MYKEMTADDHRQNLDLPEDYTVDVAIGVGTWTAYAPRNLERFERLLEEKGYESTHRHFEHLDIHEVHEFVLDDKTIWFFAVMGTAVMAPYMHYASLFGAKKLLLAGTAGGLKEGGSVGDFIIPTQTTGNDNSLYYSQSDGREQYPDADLSERLFNTHKHALSSVFREKTVTCEMMLAESWEDIKGWSDNGYAAVEMEAALVFAIGKYFNVPAAATLMVADNLVEDISIFSDEHKASSDERGKRLDIQMSILIDEALHG